MVIQGVTVLPTFEPHGGPITHSSTGSKPDSPVHPMFPKLFLAHGFVCNSRATFLVIYSGIRHNTYSRCLNPFHTLFKASNDCLPVWNFGSIVYCTERIHGNTTRGVPCVLPIEFTVRWPALWICVLLEFFPSYPFISTEKILKEGRQLRCDVLMHRNEDINAMNRPLR